MRSLPGASAPAKPGTNVFRIYDKDGRTVTSSAGFKATARIVVPVAPGAVGPGHAGGRPPVTSAPQLPEALPDRRPATGCAGSTLLNGLQGDKIDDCIQRYDEARILVEPDLGSPANLVLEGEVTKVRYEWPLTGSSASIAQVKRHYMNEAWQLGATVIADRGGYVAFELNQSGTRIYVSVDVFNDGQTIHLVTITPEAVTRR